MTRISYFFLLIICLSSCIEAVQSFDKLPPGIWRGKLILESNNFVMAEGDEEVQTGLDELNDRELPFNFEVNYDAENNLVFTFINGEERIETKDVLYGRDRKVAKDSLRVMFPEYDSYIKGYYEEDVFEGEFIIASKKNYSIPFRAKYGQKYRFTPLKKKPKIDLSGTWECTFGEGDDAYKAVGEFTQKENMLTGTFRTETGDYRFLQGTVQDDKAYLSAFDGTHVFLFTMKILDNQSLLGSFRSGPTYKSSWTAIRNEEFQLTDPLELTFVKNEDIPFTFNFPDADGDSLSIDDLKSDVKIITIMGTWCPNCKDEMNFLKEIQQTYKDQVEIVAISFERYVELDKSLASLKRYAQTMDISFPILYGGVASKKVASENFPQLNQILSFPTLIMLDKNNQVQYIHTGFNGPATSKYESFKMEFNQKLKELLSN